jgi:hypothetical protein
MTRFVTCSTHLGGGGLGGGGEGGGGLLVRASKAGHVSA